LIYNTIGPDFGSALFGAGDTLRIHSALLTSSYIGKPRAFRGCRRNIQSASKAYNLAIITNGLKEVRRPLFKKSKINKYFNEIIISDKIGAAKPDKEYFDEVFRKIGSPAKSKVLVIGDSLTSDIKGGLNYGVNTCCSNPKNAVFDNIKDRNYIIHQLTELLSFLKFRQKC
jgi:putative hydrolase of the HAD superfamily